MGSSWRALGSFIGQMTDERSKAINILYDWGRVRDESLAALNRLLLQGS